MNAIFFYLLRVIACSALFAGCYWLILRNGRFHRWNRFHILASVALSVIIPALSIPLQAPQAMPAVTDYVAHFVIDPAEVTVTPAESGVSPVLWTWLGRTACLSVVLLLLAREVASFARILRLKRRSERIRIPETVLYCTDDAAAPFTFFRAVFWKKDIPVDSGEGRTILRHELAHVRLGHSWDKALMQLVCCLFWMNPFFMLFRRELELVHEFEADSECLGEGSVEELSSLILCTLYPKHYRDFSSRFFQSSVKRRIFMITKNKNKKSMNMLRKLSIVPVVIIAMYLFACNNEVRRDTATEISQPLSESVWQESWTPQNDLEEEIIVVAFVANNVTPKEDVIVTHNSERKIARGVISYNEAEQKPVFQGSDNDFRSYLAKNLRYPAVSIENGITGTVVVSFVVDKDGKVTDVKSPVKIDLLSNELERVVQSSPAWKPGKQGRQNVAVQCYSFVRFRLNNTSTSSKSDDDEVFTVADDMPLFNGKIAEEGFRDYVAKNAIYPPQAMENSISGMVLVQFVIDTDGSLIDAKVVRPTDPLLDAEALRVINSSPKWSPGKQRGRVVKVQYTFPVRFKLNK